MYLNCSALILIAVDLFDNELLGEHVRNDRKKRPSNTGIESSCVYKEIDIRAVLLVFERHLAHNQGDERNLMILLSLFFACD